jgi:hypothetical protein
MTTMRRILTGVLYIAEIAIIGGAAGLFTWLLADAVVLRSLTTVALAWQRWAPLSPLFNPWIWAAIGAVVGGVWAFRNFFDDDIP